MKTLLLAAAALVAASTPAKAAALSDLQWQKRILILFADGENADLARQRDALLADEAALAERDMLVFAVLAPDRLVPIFGTLPTGESAATLRQRFGMAAETPFSALLIGKDGGVKWRREAPFEPAELNAVIDAMPMRQSERRQR